MHPRRIFSMGFLNLRSITAFQFPSLLDLQLINFFLPSSHSNLCHYDLKLKPLIDRLRWGRTQNISVMWPRQCRNSAIESHPKQRVLTTASLKFQVLDSPRIWDSMWEREQQVLETEWGEGGGRQLTGSSWLYPVSPLIFMHTKYNKN